MPDDRYLVATCPNPLVRGGWVFFFINATDEALEHLTLESAGVEWGDFGSEKVKGRRLGGVNAKSSVEVWSCDSDAAELNPWLTIRVYRPGGEEEELLFEFPKPYKITRLDPVPILGRPGYVCRPGR